MKAKLKLKYLHKASSFDISRGGYNLQAISENQTVVSLN